jgi:hypothetical protein
MNAVSDDEPNSQLWAFRDWIVKVDYQLHSVHEELFEELKKVIEADSFFDNMNVGLYQNDGLAQRVIIEICDEDRDQYYEKMLQLQQHIERAFAQCVENCKQHCMSQASI